MISSFTYLKTLNILKIEYPILILSSILGMMVMISSNDLIVFYLGLELQSLALYVLASFNRDNILSSEVWFKIFCFERVIIRFIIIWMFFSIWIFRIN